RLRRQQRRRPRSVSGLIRDHPQTSQQLKSRKIRKSIKLLILSNNFNFQQFSDAKGAEALPVLHRRTRPATSSRAPRLLLARFLANCFANEALMRACVRVSLCRLLRHIFRCVDQFDSWH
ncbi:hypothetical protein, partial [Agrobacterium sp. SUL3]